MAAGLNPPRQVALLGGSFDPVHLGHMALAGCALDQLPVEELWWLPAGEPWQKRRELSAAPHRLAMLELAIGREARQRVETCELERSGPTYTVDTIDELDRRHPGVRWHLILGWDQYRNLPSWKRWRELASRVRLAVARRPGTPSSTELPPELRETAFEPLHMAPWDVSSTTIRDDVAQGRSVLDRVSAPVARYIAEHGLYRPD